MTILSKLLVQPPIGLVAYPEYLGLIFSIISLLLLSYLYFKKRNIFKENKLLNLLFWWVAVFFIISRLPVGFPARFARELPLPIFIFDCFAFSIFFTDEQIIGKIKKLTKKEIFLAIMAVIVLISSRVLTLKTSNWLSGYPFEIISGHEEAAYNRANELCQEKECELYFDRHEPFSNDRRLIYIESKLANKQILHLFGQSEPKIIDLGRRTFAEVDTKKEVDSLFDQLPSNTVLVVHSSFPSNTNKVDTIAQEEIENEILIKANTTFAHREDYENNDDLFQIKFYSSRVSIFYN